MNTHLAKTLRALSPTACAVILATFPYVLFAKDANEINKITGTTLLNNISTYIINPIIFTMFTIAFVVFIWGLVQFVMNLDNEEARSTGGQHMLWGIIGMAIMMSVNGIIGIIDSTIQQIGG